MPTRLIDDPRSAGILGLGLRLMSTPGKLGPALGTAGLGAMGDMRQAQQMQEMKAQRALQQQMLQEQLAAIQRQQAERQQAQQRQQGIDNAHRNAWVSPPVGGDGVGPPEQARFSQEALIRNLLPVDAVMATQMAQPKPDELMSVAPGASVINKRDPGKPVFTAPERAKETNYNDLVIPGPDGKPMINQMALQAKRDLAHAGRSSVEVSYGAPVAGIGPDGSPVFFQPSKGGGAPSIVPGMQPPGVVADQRKEQETQTKIVDTAKRAHDTINQMLKHPGLDTALGLSGQIDPRNRIWGTDAQGAQALIEQAQGQAFLQAFETLKGGGQITEIEGKKATAAIARLQRSQNPTDFKAAAKELQDIASAAHKRATGKGLTAKTIVRTGTQNGRKVVEYSDGSIEYAD